MALIHCPKCNKEISDKVTVCPHCASMLKSDTVFDIKKSAMPFRKSKGKKVVACIIIGSILIGTGFGAGFTFGKRAANSIPDTGTVSGTSYSNSEKENDFTEVIDSSESDLMSGSLVYEDEYVQILFKGYDKNFSGETEVIFEAENKTDCELTFQSSSLALNGYDMGYLWGSNSIAPKSKGNIHFQPEENIPTDTLTKLSGQIRIIDFSEKILDEFYEVSFVIDKLDETKTESETSELAESSSSEVMNPSTPNNTYTQDKLCAATPCPNKATNGIYCSIHAKGKTKKCVICGKSIWDDEIYCDDCLFGSIDEAMSGTRDKLCAATPCPNKATNGIYCSTHAKGKTNTCIGCGKSIWADEIFCDDCLFGSIN